VAFAAGRSRRSAMTGNAAALRAANDARENYFRKAREVHRSTACGHAASQFFTTTDEPPCRAQSRR
jgi:hypothetical protein